MAFPPLVNALFKKEAYPDLPDSIELRQTHISYLFFTPKYVYKVKKPVDFGFLDFTTLEKRRFFCNQEVLLNRRLCPDMYLGVVEIKKKGGMVKIEGDGETIEYAVKMIRLPSEKMMDILLRNSNVSNQTIERLAHLLAEFHKKAEINPHISEFGKISAIKKNTDENFSQTAPFIDKTIKGNTYETIKNYADQFLKRERTTFQKRIEHGFIKDCHGDLHSEDICITNGIYIFDCIEFNERFRYSDTVADIAFLAMDLDFFNHHNLSKTFVHTYLRAMKDTDGIKLLDFYKCYRAYVRGKVQGFKSRQKEVPDEEKENAIIKAKRYFYFACLYATGGFRPLLLVLSGLTGTGKTTLAHALAQETGMPIISSDVVRKELAKIPVEKHVFDEFGKGIYTGEFTRKTYEEMMKRGESFLRNGRSVILDATFQKELYRQAAIHLAKTFAAEFKIIECTTTDEIVRERLKKRFKEDVSASDGRWKVYVKQKKEYETIKEPHVIMDTSHTPEFIVKGILNNIY